MTTNKTHEGKKIETIEIPRQWLSRLVDIYDLSRNSQGSMKDDYKNILFGFLSSAETILNQNANTK
jgi:hypothetical protein